MIGLNLHSSIIAGNNVILDGRTVRSFVEEDTSSILESRGSGWVDADQVISNIVTPTPDEDGSAVAIEDVMLDLLVSGVHFDADTVCRVEKEAGRLIANVIGLDKVVGTVFDENRRFPLRVGLIEVKEMQAADYVSAGEDPDADIWIAAIWIRRGPQCDYRRAGIIRFRGAVDRRLTVGKLRQ